MSKILFLDLDRTLFDTPRFIRVVWQTIGRVYNVDGEQQLAVILDWYRQVGKLRYYMFEEHVQHVVGQNADEVAAKIRPLLAKQNFLYDDTTEIKKWQARGDYSVRILSFGGEWFQKFKISLSPAIATMPADVILESKSDFIAREFSGDGGFLVDDKRNPHLPRGFTEVLIQRGVLQKSKRNGLIVINSFIEVTEIL